jgi:hypothetical protein
MANSDRRVPHKTVKADINQTLGLVPQFFSSAPHQ